MPLAAGRALTDASAERSVARVTVDVQHIGTGKPLSKRGAIAHPEGVVDDERAAATRKVTDELHQQLEARLA